LKEGIMLKKIFSVLFFISLFINSALAMEFSADTITTHKGGEKITGKLYYKPDRFRMEMKAHEDMIVITRMDRKVAWNIMPAMKMYMEMPFDLKNRPMVDEKFEGETERKLLGSETIDGHPTKKYLITYKSGNRTDQVYQWIATDINFPLKTAATDGSWIQEFRNVRIGSQSGSLFEVPAGYQKMDMPQMPGGMNFMQGK
jgi:outer membrane lipoprotein-sorting protein